MMKNVRIWVFGGVIVWVSASAIASPPLSPEQVRERSAHFGRALNTWYGVRESCGEGASFTGRSSEVSSRVSALSSAVAEVQSAVTAFLEAARSPVLRRLGYQLDVARVSVPLGSFVSSNAPLPTTTSTIELGSGLDTALSSVDALRSVVRREVSDARSIVSYRVERNPHLAEAGASGSFCSGGTCRDPAAALAAAAENLASKIASYQRLARSARTAVRCRRSEQEISYIARMTARSEFTPGVEIPNALTEVVHIDSATCESTADIARGIQGLVTDADSALVRTRQPMEQAVIAQWIAEHSRSHSNHSTGLGSRLNDFMSRLDRGEAASAEAPAGGMPLPSS